LALFSARPVGRQGPISAHPGPAQPANAMRDILKNHFFRID
jgi:hypothetical protein